MSINTQPEQQIALHVIDGLLKVKSHWGLYFLRSVILHGNTANGELSLPSSEVYTLSHKNRYNQDIDEAGLAERSGSVKAALRSGWTKLESDLIPEINR